MLKDKLQIYIITYDRKYFLERTLENILSDNSPIKDFDITILDNASTDGSSELIEEYVKTYTNIKHIRHPYNIGGNANICRAFEYATACGKEYAWILCDDDGYDFSCWSEVEENINAKKDIICVSDYVFPSEESKKNPAYQIFQLTFVPSIIFRTDAMSSSVLTNMYDNIYSMFQQTCLLAKVINNNGDIKVLSKSIVFNGIHLKDRTKNVSLTRGYFDNPRTERRKKTTWILGFSNVITLLDNKKLITEALEAAIEYKDIYGSWEKFYRCIYKEYFNFKYFNYFYEIYKFLSPKRKYGFIIYLCTIFIRRIIAFIKTVQFKLKHR